jgi:hypothetical protein
MKVEFSRQIFEKYSGKGQGQGHPITGHESPEREQRYSSIISLTWAIDGVGGQRHAPAALPPGKDPVPIAEEAVWAPGPVWTGGENLAAPPTGIRSPDRPALSESLYGRSYRGHEKYSGINFNDNGPAGSRVVPCGRTERHDEAVVALRSFSNGIISGISRLEEMRSAVQ